MIKIGERDRRVGVDAVESRDFYEDEVDTAIASLTSIIEPLMIIGVGSMVGVIVISMYLPMFSMSSRFTDRRQRPSGEKSYGEAFRPLPGLSDRRRP